MPPKKKIFLISPARRRAPGEDFIFKMAFLNLPYLAAVTPHDYDVVIIDEEYEAIDFDAKVWLVALTAQTPVSVRAYEVADRFRKLGVPTVVDRLIQQALHQVLNPLFDPGFSSNSYGFRPGRSAHQALCQARDHVAGGRRWVVDLDLEKFFDRVHHDVLMSRVARKVGDKRMLGLIRRYLQAGIMDGGLVSQPTMGTP